MVLAATEVVEHQVAHDARRPGPEQIAVSTSAALTTWQLVELPIELLLEIDPLGPVLLEEVGAGDP